MEGNALGSVCDGVVCEGDKEGGLEMLEHSIDDSGSGDGFVIRREELVKVLIQRNSSHETKARCGDGLSSRSLFKEAWFVVQ